MKRLTPIHTAEGIALSRQAGHIAAKVLHMLIPHVRAGVSTKHLDKLCHDYIVGELECIPANIGYHGFTKTICASVNHVVCHGIPSDREILKEGDIVNIDVALIKDGWFGDTSRMYLIGEPRAQARRLVRTTYEAMLAGIHVLPPWPEGSKL